ncbi:putative gustatory receptor 2a [Schistocerca serialis cubense]|uniref:putative gustatory receptor 2a n=1 Tax=Schistocerca serialis cubense TaxID=2023355 RepID=UPI00214EEF40|nr:putative gustatory receptor 2a [Schistocerca serialis cubense]
MREVDHIEQLVGKLLLLVTPLEDRRLHTDLHNFTHQLSCDRISYSAAALFHIDRSLLTSCIAAIAISIYLVILVEFGLPSLTTSVNNAYGVPNLSEISSYFVCIVMNMYFFVIYLFDIDSTLQGPQKTHTLLSLSLWTGLMVLRLVILAYSSEMVVQEASRTQRLVTKLQMLPVPASSGCQEELLLFEEQLARSPLHYSAAGFFALDLSLLKSFVAAVTTYLVILVQFQIPDTNKE